jgi:hypothetical protein
MIYPVLLTREDSESEDAQCALVRASGRVDFVAEGSSCWGNYGSPDRAFEILRSLGYTRVL